MSDDPAEFANRPTKAVSPSPAGGNAVDPLLNAPTLMPGQVPYGQQQQPPQPQPNQPQQQPQAVTQDRQRTQMYRPRADQPQEPAAAGGAAAANLEAASSSLEEGEMLVGWLVVIKGPGKGRGLALGYGWNTVGRGADQRVRIDFGDLEISRENHCSITYDGKNRKFYVQHGGGKNLTYLGDQPVLAPAELHNMMDISLGNTVLRFVAFCDTRFDWIDIA